MQLDLHEANKKLQSSQSNSHDNTGAMRKQLEDEKKNIEDMKKHLDEQRKNFDSKRKEVEEKEKELNELDRQLKKRKEQMDQLEASLKKVCVDFRLLKHLKFFINMFAPY